MEIKSIKLGKFGNGGEIAVKCFCKSTRSGFSHNAVAYVNGEEVTAKCSYINRTWESYCYQSVLKCFCEKLTIALFGVPSVHALWNTKKWGDARECANFLLAQV